LAVWVYLSVPTRQTLVKMEEGGPLAVRLGVDDSIGQGSISSTVAVAVAVAAAVAAAASIRDAQEEAAIAI